MKKLLRILIVEDNADHVDLLSEVIERHFAPVDLHTVESIEDAIDFIEQTKYDLVLTDCYINNESIVEQIPHMRNKLGDIPIIVVTGSGDETLAAQVIKKGATDYLVKSRESLEKVPVLIRKYTVKESKSHEFYKAQVKEPPPLRDKILHEVNTLSRRARTIASSHRGHLPDVKQLESLIEQIQHLKELASKLTGK